jgi:hypothetical protein
MRGAEKTKRKSEPEGFAALLREKANTRFFGVSSWRPEPKCTNSVASSPAPKLRNEAAVRPLAVLAVFLAFFQVCVFFDEFLLAIAGKADRELGLVT